MSLTALCSTEWLIEERSHGGTELFILAWRAAPKRADMRQAVDITLVTTHIHINITREDPGLLRE